MKQDNKEYIIEYVPAVVSCYKVEAANTHIEMYVWGLAEIIEHLLQSEESMSDIVEEFKKYKIRQTTIYNYAKMIKKARERGYNSGKEMIEGCITRK